MINERYREDRERRRLGSLTAFSGPTHSGKTKKLEAEAERAQRQGRRSQRLAGPAFGALVAVMQRLHERDVAAFCRDAGFVHVCLPAEADTRTELVFPRSGRTQVRERGDLLWPAREGPAVLAKQQVLLGSAAYAGATEPIRSGDSADRLYRCELKSSLFCFV